MKTFIAFLLCGCAWSADLRVAREGNFLVIHGPQIPEIRINYLEAYCRGNSAQTDWVKHTVIPHKSSVVSESPRHIQLRDVLADGVTVDHTINVLPDGIEFSLLAQNPGSRDSEAQWAQPCVRLGAFTGFDPDYHKGDPNDYLSKCFVFLDGKISRMPTTPWSTEARYTPGQVWRAWNVSAADVNPRPLNPRVTSNGLIGCFSGDEKLIFATAWQPYQELFQGVGRCIHSDFRIGGLVPGEKKPIRGRIYIVPDDVGALLKRYNAEFPEHRSRR